MIFVTIIAVVTINNGDNTGFKQVMLLLVIACIVFGYKKGREGEAENGDSRQPQHLEKPSAG